MPMRRGTSGAVKYPTTAVSRESATANSSPCCAASAAPASFPAPVRRATSVSVPIADSWMKPKIAISTNRLFETAVCPATPVYCAKKTSFSP